MDLGAQSLLLENWKIINNNKRSSWQVVSNTNFNFPHVVVITARAKNTCQTAACIATAADVLETLNQDVKPCDNFYNFACGGLINSTLLSDDMMTLNQYAKVYHKLVRQLLALVSAPSPETDIRPFKLAKKFFQSCMNRTQIEEEGLKPLIALKEELGGWPVVDGDDWDASWSWTKVAIRARKLGLGMNSLFGLWLGFDAKNMTVRRLTVNVWTEAATNFGQYLYFRQNIRRLINQTLDYLESI